jgi:stage III sporulation protein AF
MFSAWATRLVYLILFASVVEMLLPSGELRRYTKMVLGLVVILVVIDPLVQIVTSSDWADSLILPTRVANSPSVQSSVQAGIEISRTALSSAAGAVRRDTEDQVAALLLTLDGVQRAQVDLAEETPRISLGVDRDRDVPALALRASRLVGVCLSISPESVEVQIEGLGGQ